ncbi:MAG: AMP-binding protein [Myxococcales bacterium]|nr:AMP-binding protein [Myxococcales bacterium]
MMVKELSIYAAAREKPRATAVVVGDTELSFAELASRVTAVEERLRQLWSPGTRVAMVAHPDLASLVVVSAALEAGIVPCMFHPRWPASMAADMRTRLSIPGSVVPYELTNNNHSGQRVRVPSSVPFHPADADGVIFFTSGTSGMPKGVRLSRRALVSAAEASANRLGWVNNDRWGLRLPIAHVGGFSVLIRTRLGRKPVVLPDPEDAAGFEPDRFMTWLNARRITIVSMVPTMLRRLVDAEWIAPRHMRVVLVGGALSGAELLAQAAALGWPVLSTYGMTEMASQIATQKIGTKQPSVDQGWPLEGVELKIDPTGHIWVQGPTLMSGYLPCEGPATKDGWLPTGDCGHLDNCGRLVVEGRRDELIICGGENVAPARVEVVLRQCRCIDDIVVFGKADTEWGQVVEAALTLRKATYFSRDEYAKFEEQLAAYERPRRLWVLERMPMLPSGKVDRHQVRLLTEGRAVREVLPDLN